MGTGNMQMPLFQQPPPLALIPRPRRLHLHIQRRIPCPLQTRGLHPLRRLTSHRSLRSPKLLLLTGLLPSFNLLVTVILLHTLYLLPTVNLLRTLNLTLRRPRRLAPQSCMMGSQSRMKSHRRYPLCLFHLKLPPTLYLPLRRPRRLAPQSRMMGSHRPYPLCLFHLLLRFSHLLRRRLTMV